MTSSGHLLSVALLVVMVCANLHAEDRLLAYEGFEYPESADSISMDGGYGWAGAWQGAPTTAAGSFHYGMPGLPTWFQQVATTGEVHLENATHGSGGNVVYRALPVRLTECWISMLVNARGDWSTIEFQYFDDNNNARTAFRLLIDPVTPPNPVGRWFLAAPLNAGSAYKDTGVQAWGPAPKLIVIHMSPAFVRVYINPAQSSEPSPSSANASATAVELSDTGGDLRMMAFQQLLFYAAEQVMVDEIRIASSYAGLWMDPRPGKPTVHLEVIDAVAAEPDNTAQFVVVRKGVAQKPLQVRLEYSGTAVNGVDVQLLPTMVTLPSGMVTSRVALDVVPIDDVFIEGLEYLSVRILPDDSYALGMPSSVTITIEDDDAAVVSLSAIDDDAAEGVPLNTGTVRLTRTGRLDRPLTVQLRYSGSAQNGVDYQTLPTSVTFQVGQQHVDLQVIPIDDGLIEGSESVIVTLVVPSENPTYLVGTGQMATVWIRATPQGYGAPTSSASVDPAASGCASGSLLALLTSIAFVVLPLARYRRRI